jgi:hypothetical protein
MDILHSLTDSVGHTMYLDLHEDSAVLHARVVGLFAMCDTAPDGPDCSGSQQKSYLISSVNVNLAGPWRSP